MKRCFIVLISLILLLISAPARMLYIVINSDKLPDISNSTRKTVLSSLRGEILDVNGEKLVNRTKKTLTIAKPCEKSAEILKPYLTKEQYYNLTECIASSTPFVTECQYSSENEFVTHADILKRYTSDGFLCHVIGYTNLYDNEGIYGIEKSFQQTLTEDSKELLYTYNISGYGEALAGGEGKIQSENYYSQSGIKLTIDRDIQKITENAMKLFDIKCGAAVVLDSQSGEIRAMASAPVFDQNDVSHYLNDSSAPFLNRAVSAYSVGSVFKIVVAAAAVKNGLDDFISYCDGSLKISEKLFSCSDFKSHGVMNLSDALAHSCNTYFIRLALKIGAEEILKTAESLGFGKSFSLAEGFYSSNGKLPEKEEITTDGMLANLAFGQGNLLATPLQVASCYASVVSGSFISPSLVLSHIDADGTETAIGTSPYKYRAFSEEETKKLKELLMHNFTVGTCVSAKPEGIVAGGKTSTAETGWVDEKGKEILHSWFAGFAEKNKKIYTIVVFKEDGTSGAGDCGPVFKEIAQRICE